MLAYQRGDADAFECLYRRHKDGLFAFLYRSLPQQAVVEELAQDAWMAVIKAASRYTAQGNFKTWLYQIGHNRLVDFWRRKDNQHMSIDEIAEPLAAATQQVQHSTHTEAEQHIMQAIAALPMEQRNVVLLREQGFSLAQISQITDTPAETVKSRLRYARKQLRACLADDSGVPA